MQNCGLYKLPTELGLASRLCRLRLADVQRGIYFRMDDLGTFSSMCSLEFLSVTQARPEYGDSLTYCAPEVCVGRMALPLHAV